MSDAPFREMYEEGEATDSENPSAYPPSIQAGIPKLGVTPKGWTCFLLGDLLRKVERPAKLVDSETYQLVTAKRSRGGIVARENLRGDQIRTKTQFYVETGDFLISNRQISHGACGVVPASLHRAIVSNEYTAFHTSDALDLRFLNVLSHSVYFQQTCFHSSVGVHVEKLVFRLEDWLDWEFDIPPLPEQRRIVAVLDAWDRAIDQTERLIATKRQRKMGLLSGVFGSERNPLKTQGVPLGDLASIHYGKGLAPRDYVENGQSPVFGTQGEIGRTELRLFDGPAIVVGRKGTLDQPIFIDAPRPFWAIDTTFVVRPTVNAWLLHAFLDYVDLTGLNEASGVPSLSSDNLGSLLVPPKAFDRADKVEPLIRAIDKDIGNTTDVLALAIKQKRGLMQKLLTGQRRLDERFDPPMLVPRAARVGSLT